MSEIIDICAPKDEQEGTESQLGQWFIAIGDYIEKNKPLLEINTDKVTLEVSAPESGVLKEILVESGQEISPGDILGRLEASGAPDQSSSTPSEVATPAAKASTGVKSNNQRLSPAVRKLLEKHGLQASDVQGTGRDGRITADDVKAHVGSGAKAANITPHTPMRKKIADHMVHSLLHTAPHVTTVFEVSLARLMKDREAKKSEFEKQGARLTFSSYFIQATVAALKAVPEVNSRWHDNGLEIFDECHIGVATALEKTGLVVPVLRNAEKMELFDIATNLQALTTKARDGKLERTDLEGGTFTMSNHGVSGSLIATPIIINQPQSAILGIGKLEERVKWDTEKSAPTMVPSCYVTLTIDHRVLDGYQANLFMSTFVEHLESL